MNGNYVEPEPGMSGWVHGERGHALPEGLPHMSPVRLIRFTGWQDRQAIVEFKGEEIEVQSAVLDFGRWWESKKGKVIFEGDERARVWMLRKLHDIRTHGGTGLYMVHNTSQMNRELSDLEWLLRRNGWEVPQAS